MSVQVLRIYYLHSITDDLKTYATICLGNTPHFILLYVYKFEPFAPV